MLSYPCTLDMNTNLLALQQVVDEILLVGSACQSNREASLSSLQQQMSTSSSVISLIRAYHYNYVHVIGIKSKSISKNTPNNDVTYSDNVPFSTHL